MVTTPQISSIQAIDAWVSIINGNVAGVVRTGFKRTSPSFLGGGAREEVSGMGGAVLRLQLPEATMTLGSTIDFSQGPIAASSSRLHMALNGPGFFPVVPPNNTDPVLYTRDGEFRLQEAGGGVFYLVNSSGLRLFLPGAPATVATTTSNDPDQVDIYRLGSGPFRPLEIVVPAAPHDSLRYSAWGATVFERVPGAAAMPAYILDNNNRPKFIGGRTSIVQQGLEASNADLNTLIPELALAQKMFTAIGKLIQSQNDRYDQIFQVIR